MQFHFQPRFFACLKDYTKEKFYADAMAGIIVGIVALPLAIAFGIASGVGPTEGLVTAIIAGFLISLLGGTNIEQHGLSGLMIATVMAGILLVLMGVFRLGNIIKFVPYPVIVGFTGGIALTIFSTQMNDLFGLGIEKVPSDFIGKWACYVQNFTHINWLSLAMGIVSILIIVLTPKVSKKIPGSLVAIIVMTLVGWLLKTYAGVTSLTTIGDLYELPTGIPAPHVPALELAEGETFFTLVKTLFPAALTIALLGAIESLLSAMVADGVIGDHHDSNTELVGQGVANIFTPFFGGIPATGAIARTMTNINNGGKTPVAGLVHAFTLLLILLVLGRLVGYIPMSCLAGVLIVVSYNMSGWRSFVGLAKNPKSDFAVLMVTFLLTVIFDLTVAIEIGLLLAIVLFLKRTNEATVIRAFHDEIDPSSDTDFDTHEERLQIPEKVEVYEIDGPYFFGIANKFDEIMMHTGRHSKVRIIRMRKVSFIDSTGIHNLELLCNQSKREGIQVVLSGVNERVHETLTKAGIIEMLGEANVCRHINLALVRAEQLIKE